jgi:hypothetical protein
MITVPIYAIALKIRQTWIKCAAVEPLLKDIEVLGYSVGLVGKFQIFAHIQLESRMAITAVLSARMVTMKYHMMIRL